MKRFTPFLIPLCLAAFGCAGTALRTDDTQQQEVQALKARILELQREAAMNQVELAQLRQRMAEMEGRGGAAPAAPVRSMPAVTTPPPPKPSTAPAPAPVTTRPAAPAPSVEPRREPRTVAEPIEEVDIELPANEPQPPPAAKPATPKPATAAPPGVYRPTPQATTPPAPANPAPPAVTAPSPANGEPIPETLSPANQVLYDRGYTLYHQGHFVDAETSFQRFLQANPGSELADNAQYWIGECRYARNEMKAALAAFREVIEKFPKGNKVPDAMLKAGQCLEGMGDVEGARVTYREVARRFPGSAAASVAEERRAKLP
ncbi:MAG: tol-pal system protein YbgF [Thermoanaerobaculia bacterium]